MANLKNIKNKTYKNFMRVYNALIAEKHYTRATAEMLTHRVFDAVDAARADYPKNTYYSVQYFYDRIITAEQYAREYGAEK